MMADVPGSSSAPPPAGEPPLYPPGESLVGKLYIRTARLEWMERVPVFDLLNGKPEDVRSLLVRPTIPSAYHWIPIDGLEPKAAIHHVDAFISCHLAHFMSNPPAGMALATARKVAICLGVSRAVATSYYNLAVGDLASGEVTNPLLHATTGEGGVVAMTFTPYCVGPVGEAMKQKLVLTQQETAVVANMLLCTVGTLPLQGLSLMTTQHHYLSDVQGQSRKAYMAVEKQFWRGVDVAPWYQANTEAIQDALWHKALHPVNLTIKYRAATSEQIRKMLTDLGAGSAAARLPALESEVRTATSYMTLFDTVRTVIEQFNGGIDDSLLETAVRMVKAYPPGVDNPVQPADRPGDVPVNVSNRRTATEWVRQIVERNAATAAWCYGFYSAMSDQSVGLGAGGQVDTLKNAFSLAKLRTTHVASYVSGTQSYGDYQTARVRRRDKGVYEGPKLTLH